MAKARKKMTRTPNAKSDREPRDFYPTPTWCVKGLLDLIVIRPDDVLLEPCIGSERISNELPKDNLLKWAELDRGVDYLNNDLDLTADVIITNPPFSLFKEFIITALTRDLKPQGTVAMLLRMSALGSRDRAHFWREYPPTHQIVLTPRPSFVGGSDNSEYAWFVWDYGNRMNCPIFWNIKKSDYI